MEGASVKIPALCCHVLPRPSGDPTLPAWYQAVSTVTVALEGFRGVFLTGVLNKSLHMLSASLYDMRSISAMLSTAHLMLTGVCCTRQVSMLLSGACRRACRRAAIY